MHSHIGGIAAGIVLVDHPVIVVAVHPKQAQLGSLSSRHDERAHVVLYGIVGNLLRTSHFSVAADAIFPNLVDTVLVIGTVLGRDGKVEVASVLRVDSHAARIAAFGGVPVLVEGMSGILHPCALPL